MGHLKHLHLLALLLHHLLLPPPLPLLLKHILSLLQLPYHHLLLTHYISSSSFIIFLLLHYDTLQSLNLHPSILLALDTTFEFTTTFGQHLGLALAIVINLLL